ncbi:MAG: MBL fold metallo-hydrolase [Candidatus Aenigmarchaeota archaeon]|nr:MBL fold metallo-hydrolase [Candidatus Aenigmarchaeota archaeon]
MTKIDILVEGYAKEIENGWNASSNVTLVTSNSKNIIVDPGCNRKLLLDALEKHKLKTGDIDFVLNTHNHTDHTLLTSIFENAKVITTDEIYAGDHQVEHNNKIPETNLEIIQVPGHTPKHCALVVKTEKGTYVIAGDVFWWIDNEEQKIDIKKKILRIRAIWKN